MEESMKLYNDDCLDVFKVLSDSSVDCCITDCPYRIVSGGVSTGKQSACWKTKECGRYECLKTGKMFACNTIKFDDWLLDLFRVLRVKDWGESSLA